MNKFQQFVEDNKDDATTKKVNLTKDQVEVINNFSRMLDISFEDTVMLFVELQFSDISMAYLRQSTVKN
jgi:hypothetical protein